MATVLVQELISVNQPASFIRSSAAREIVFIDPAVEAIDVMLAGLRPGVEAILLDAEEPAPRQMARALVGREGIEAIHVIAHGAPGEVCFSAGILSARTIQAHADDLAELGRTRPRLLLWSCNTGAGEMGRRLVHTIVHSTGMEVATSSRLVGSAACGGAWELDTPVAAPLTTQGAAAYPATLGITINLNNAAGTGTTAFTEQTQVSLFPSATFSTNGADNNAVDSITIDLASPTSTMSLSLTAAAASAASAAGITVSYNASTGTLTLSGNNESTTTWQSILQGVQYNDTSEMHRPILA
jgi:Domain of unknown function (DUF4347)